MSRPATRARRIANVLYTAVTSRVVEYLATFGEDIRRSQEIRSTGSILVVIFASHRPWHD